MSAVVEKALLKAREAFFRNVTKDVKFRIQQLKQLRKCIDENEEEMVASLKSDLNKSRMESIITEIDFVRKDIQYQLDHINEYVKPHYVKKGLPNLMDSCFIQYDPYGVVLIFSAWNYPLQIALCPLVGAIAAGNCAILKPSELASNTEQLLANILPRYLDRECYHVITGGPDEATRMLNERFDMIFFTGSSPVGKIVYNAAAKFLTPVVLELGGKSPVYLDDTVSNMEVAIKRILWGKYMNTGQTCIAPDYLLCSSDVQEKFIPIAAKVLKEFFGEDPKKSDSYGRIINQRNFDRLEALIKSTKGKIVYGGDTDRDSCFISPTIVTNVTSSDPIMKDEIFGPIFPIINVDSSEEAVEFIRRGEKPLTLYVYTNKKDVYKRFLNETSSGSIAVNECLLQMTVESLPFGGVGNSGLGRYHGRYSFEAFSHPKSVLIKDYNPLVEFIAKSRYPPYNDSKLSTMRKLVSKTLLDDIDFGKTFSYLFAFISGIVGTLLVYAMTEINK